MTIMLLPMFSALSLSSAVTAAAAATTKQWYGLVW